MSYMPGPVALDGKHPLERADYSLDFDRWLPAGDALSSITSFTADAGLTIDDSPAPAISGETVVFWAEGGTSGVTYRGECVVTTTGGRVLVVNWELPVLDPTP